MPDPDGEGEAVATLLDLLDVQYTGPMEWRGGRRPGGVGRIFGGQVVAQALAAAARSTAGDRSVHSLHAYFLRGGDEDHPIEFTVTNDMEGGNFSNRRVVASQKDRPILNLIASFHRKENGLSHQRAMPDVPRPLDIPDRTAFLEACAENLPPAARLLMTQGSPIEFVPVSLDSFVQDRPVEPVSNIWFRLAGRIEAPHSTHQAILAYASDFGLISTALLPHAIHHVRDQLRGASLDHAIWFHGAFDVSQWLLYHTHSPWAGGARSLTLGSIFTEDGSLVASTAQEGLVRLVPAGGTYSKGQ